MMAIGSLTDAEDDRAEGEFDLLVHCATLKKVCFTQRNTAVQQR